MILYLYVFLCIIMILYVIFILRFKWNLDYYTELEKSCIFK